MRAIWIGKTDNGRRMVFGGTGQGERMQLLQAANTTARGSAKSWTVYVNGKLAGDWHWGVNEQFWTWLDGLLGRER